MRAEEQKKKLRDFSDIGTFHFSYFTSFETNDGKIVLEYEYFNTQRLLRAKHLWWLRINGMSYLQQHYNLQALSMDNKSDTMWWIDNIFILFIAL